MGARSGSSRDSSRRTGGGGGGGGDPTGPAGGDLAGTYPDPEVVAVQATDGRLAIGDIDDGEMVVRSGSDLVGAPVPTSLPPSGAAGGNLGGTYPNPIVDGITETGGPTSLGIGAVADGQLLVRSGSSVVGQTGAAPSGAAGGQLGGTYPNPDVRGLRETGGPTSLTMGAVADGQFLARSGSTIVGQDAVGRTIYQTELPSAAEVIELSGLALASGEKTWHAEFVIKNNTAGQRTYRLTINTSVTGIVYQRLFGSNTTDGADRPAHITSIPAGGTLHIVVDVFAALWDVGGGGNRRGGTMKVSVGNGATAAEVHVTSFIWDDVSTAITALGIDSDDASGCGGGSYAWAIAGGGVSTAGGNDAGGDLDGTYPDPTVVAIQETSGPDRLAFGDIADGQMLVRDGAEVVGQAIPSGGGAGVNMRGLRISDPGGAYSSGVTRVHVAGIHHQGWTNPSLSNVTYFAPRAVSDMQISPKGNILCFPEFFLEDGNIVRLLCKTLDNPVANAKARIGVWEDAGRYPGALVVDSGDIDVSVAGVREALVTAPYTAGSYRWIGITMNADVGASQTFHSCREGAFFPILGFALTDNFAGGADVETAGIGWAHSFTYGALPDPFPSSSPVVILARASQAGNATLPAIFFGEDPD